MATAPAHWLGVPELEARLAAIKTDPPDLQLLCAAVNDIAGTLTRRVKMTAGRGAMVTFESPRLAYFNVVVQGNEYHVFYQHEAAQLDLVFQSTEELAWRICGYPCSPAEMRVARERAAREGITDKVLPVRFFRTHRKPTGVANAQPQSH